MTSLVSGLNILNAGQVYACPGIAANLLAKNTLQTATSPVGPFTDAASSIVEPGIITLGGFVRCITATIVEVKKAYTTGSPSVPSVINPIPSYGEVILGDGPVYYWRLDETTGTLTYDVVSAKSGNINGGVLLNQPGAVAGNAAMTFNGTTGFIQTVTPISVIGNIYSIEAWVKTLSTSFMEIAEINNIQFYVNGNQAGANVGGIGFNTFFPINDGAWHHVVLVSTGTVVAIYVDGVFKLSGLGVSQSIGGTPFFIGRYWGSAVNFFNGGIDEVAVYPYVLSLATIQKHYNASISSYSQLVIRDNPNHYWRLNDLAGPVIDSALVPQNGTINGVVGLNQSGPMPSSKAMLFDGSATSHIALGALNTPIIISYEAWVKFTDSITQSPIITNYNAGTSGAYFGKGTSKLFDYMPNGAGAEANFSVSDINTGQWVHVVLTYDGTTSRMYINGVLDQTKLQTNIVGNALGFIAHNLGIPTEGFPGLISEVALYNYVLSAAQIAAHYAARLLP